MLEKQLIRYVGSLYSARNRDSDQFRSWKTLWIAHNGEIGRKKAVDTTALARYLSLEETTVDPYEYAYAVESALVFAAETARTEFVKDVKPCPLSDLFLNAAPFPDEARHQTEFATSLRELIRRDPKAFLASDPFRDFYHALLPKAVRHTLGAYLTPPELCDYVLAEIDAEGAMTSETGTVLEPNCGFGSFFAALFRVACALVDKHKWSVDQASAFFSERVMGIEKNIASAAISGAFLDCISAFFCAKNGGETAKVYCADSAYLSPHDAASRLGQSILPVEGSVLAGVLLYRTAPTPEVTHIFSEDGWKPSGATVDAALAALSPTLSRVQRDLIEDANKLRDLESITHIIGNPPWINWENIDPAYRAFTIETWPELGLFSHTGRGRSFSKEDLSVFVAYSVCLRFGAAGTRVCLLMPQAIFQSRQNSKGFRRFQLGQRGAHLKVERVTDFSSYAGFGDAKTRTAVLTLDIGGPTTYPVAYRRFSGDGRNGVPAGFEELRATPSDPADPSSNWALYSPHEIITKEKRELGVYRARTGVFTGGANAIYYVKLKGSAAETLIVENDTDRAKLKVPTERFNVEQQAVWPFMKGRDLNFWSPCRAEDNGILLLHTETTKMRPLPEEMVMQTMPGAYRYLAQHREFLMNRGSLTALDKPNVKQGFYALLRVGDYTFAPYKVAWRYIASSFICAVVPPTPIAGVLKPTILQEKLISIPFWDESEAYFVCGYLSTSKVRAEIQRRIVGTQVSVHVIEDLHIPKFDPSEPIHVRIAELCKAGHKNGGASDRSQAELDKDLDLLGND